VIDGFLWGMPTQKNSIQVHTTWVKIHGIPGYARKEKIVMKIAGLAGEPNVVDELSLIQIGPIRVKMNCRDSLKVKGVVRVLINKARHNIRFEAEKYGDRAPGYPPPLRLEMMIQMMVRRM
jgi:hypothetical protein